jgi:DNA-binding IclR family transcriptional regulator
MNDQMPDRALGAQSIERAISMLRIVATSGSEGAKLAEVVTASRLSRGTVYRILLALTREGLIEQDPDSKLYLLGPEAYVLGTIASERYGIHTLALPALRRLADVSQDTAFLSVVRGYEIVCVQREEGAYPIKTHVLKPGDRHPLGVSSAGQAVLAAMDDRQVEQILAANTELIRSKYTHYSPKLVRNLILEARRNGVAVNPGLIWPGSWGIGIAVLNASGTPIAALNISAIESRMRRATQRELAVHLRREATWLSEQLAQLQSPRQLPRAQQR